LSDLVQLSRGFLPQTITRGLNVTFLSTRHWRHCFLWVTSLCWLV